MVLSPLLRRARKRCNDSTITRRTVDRGQTHDPKTSPIAQGRASAGRGSTGVDGDSVCSSHGSALEHASPRIGLWQRRYLLAAAQRVDRSRHLAGVAWAFVECLGKGRGDRPFAGGHRQRIGEGGFWGANTGPNPTDRAKNGCKRHIITDASGIPLVVQTGPANQRDEQLVKPLLKTMPPIQGPRGRPRSKPAVLQGMPLTVFRGSLRQ